MLRAYRDYRALFEEWFYWAPGKASGVEVDLLLRRGKDFVALEAKSSRQVRDADLRGLRAIAELPHVRRRLVVYTGERRLATEDGIEMLPVREFLTWVESGDLFR